MAGFLSRNYSSKPQSETQESLDRLEPELAPEEGSSEPYYKNVEVRARTEEPAQDIPQSEREPKSANKKEVDSGAIPHPPLDPNAKYNQSRRKAQSEWAKRRREGFVDYGAEMGEDAKIWQVYANRGYREDEKVVETYQKTLDVLLIFAALFSAISTAFMAISVQSLRQDPVDTSAQTLLVISQTLIAMSGGGPPNSSSSGLGQAVAEFRPSFIAIAINGLWFSSLGLSLAVSFITMLAKEWCATLMIDRTFGTYKSQARLRQRRWNEIERLGMANVLGALFLFLHLALALFGAGLCIYLWDLSIYIAIPVTAIALASLLVYISTAVHSITVENSPYTAMSSLHVKYWLSKFVEFVHSIFRAAIGISIKQWPWMGKLAAFFHQYFVSFHAYIGTSTRKWPWMTKLAACFSWLFQTKVQRVDENDEPEMDLVTSQILAWLSWFCCDSRAADTLVFALAGAEPWLPRLPLLEANALNVVFGCLDSCFEYNTQSQSYRLRYGASPDRASLCLRALQFLLGYHNKEGFILHTGPKVVMKDTWSRDFYVNDKSGMASRIVDDGLDFRIERFSADPDITVFWSNFSFAIASETDPQHPRYFDLFQNEAIEKIEAHINCAIVLHPTTLIATVRQMTNKLCLLTHPGDNHPWTPFRLCFLLLRLYLHSERYDKHEDLQHAISIAVAAAVLNFGEFPGSSHPPGPATSAARAAEFVVQHNPPRSITFGSVKTSPLLTRRYEITRLLGFGLIGLLELPLAHQITSEDLETWVAAHNQVHAKGRLAEHVGIHSVPPTFTSGVHAARAVTHYMQGSLPSCSLTANGIKLFNCFQAVCDYVLSEKDEDNCHQAVHSALLSILCTATSPEQTSCCTRLLAEAYSGCSKLCCESLPSGILSRLRDASRLEGNFVAPTAMCQLWNLTRSMVSLSEGSPKAMSHLLSLMPPGATSVPKTPGELGLLQQWLPCFRTMCKEIPQELLDSGVLHNIRDYYQSGHRKDAVVFDRPDGSETIQGSRIVEILLEIEEECRLAVASQPRIWPELPFYESTVEPEN